MCDVRNVILIYLLLLSVEDVIKAERDLSQKLYCRTKDCRYEEYFKEDAKTKFKELKKCLMILLKQVLVIVEMKVLMADIKYPLTTFNGRIEYIFYLFSQRQFRVQLRLMANQPEEHIIQI